MTEIRYNNEYGTLGQSLGSASVGQSQTFPNLFASAPGFATLANGDFVKLCVDANTDDFEVMYLTSYTANSVGGTVTRAAEDGDDWPALAHTTSSTWGNNPTVVDFSVGPILKGPFRFTYEDYDALLAGVTLWTAVAGDSIEGILTSVPVTPFDGVNQANVTADSPPTSVPLTITGANDTFVYTSDGGQGTPETFRIASGTYATLADIDAAVMAATGTHSDVFGDYVTVTDDGTELIFTTVAYGNAQNGNTITEGNGGGAAIGVTSPPDTFSGGGINNANLGIYLGVDAFVTLDVAQIDVPNSAAAASTLQFAGIGTPEYYIPGATDGVPFVAKWNPDPGGPITQGECYVYGLIMPRLIETT